MSSELDRLEEVGLLDDGAFARELAEHHLTVRGSGRRAVAGALAAKGVSRETIDATLAGLEGDESVRALEVATDRARRLTSLRPEVAYGRLVSFLARRGYDGGTSPRGRQGGPGARRPARLSAGSAPTRGHPCLCRAHAVGSVRTRFICWSTFNRA